MLGYKNFKWVFSDVSKATKRSRKWQHKDGSWWYNVDGKIVPYSENTQSNSGGTDSSKSPSKTWEPKDSDNLPDEMLRFSGRSFDRKMFSNYYDKPTLFGPKDVGKLKPGQVVTAAYKDAGLSFNAIFGGVNEDGIMRLYFDASPSGVEMSPEGDHFTRTGMNDDIIFVADEVEEKKEEAKKPEAKKPEAKKPEAKKPEAEKIPTPSVSKPSSVATGNSMQLAPAFGSFRLSPQDQKLAASAAGVIKPAPSGASFATTKGHSRALGLKTLPDKKDTMRSDNEADKLYTETQKLGSAPAERKHLIRMVNMANAITDPAKAMRRFVAFRDDNMHVAAALFINRAGALLSKPND